MARSGQRIGSLKQPRQNRRGISSWNKGKPWPDETKRKFSQAAKKRGMNPALYSAEAIAKRAQSISPALKAKWQEPEFRNKLLRHLADLNQNTTSETLSQRAKKLWREAKYRDRLLQSLARAREIALSNPESRQKLSEAAKRQWQTMKIEMIKAQRRGMHTPNKKEEYLLRILESYFPGEWKYVGNGDEIVGNLVPDFMNDGQKLIIELFGDYWHGPQVRQAFKTEDERREVYAAHGYDLLVIWEHELRENDAGEIEEKIEAFMEASNAN